MYPKIFSLCLPITGILYLPVMVFSASPSIVATVSKIASSANVSSQSKPLPPPIAKKVKHEMKIFGDVRIDNYYWLRDDSFKNPEVITYLKQENAYTEAIMSGTKTFEEELYAEMRGRLKEDDMSIPLRRGPYYYYTRTLKGKEYIQHCRRPVPNSNSPPSVHDFIPTGPDAPPERVLLDENVKAQEYDYYSIGDFEVSPNNNFVAYAEDTKGNENYTIYIIDAESGAPIGNPLVGVSGNLRWAGNEALVYSTMDETHRADKIWLHKLGSDQSNNSCLYHEKDDTFSLGIIASQSEKYLFISSENELTRFVYYLEASKPQDGPKVLTPRINGISTTDMGHRGNHFFITQRSDEFFNSELLACPVSNTSSTTVLIPHRASVKIVGLTLSEDHIVVYESEQGLPKVTGYRLPAIEEPLVRLQGGQEVKFTDPVCSVKLLISIFSSAILRVYYNSLRTPPSIYDFDLNTGESVLKKTKIVLGGFDESNYVTERKWANASDGTQIPISIAYRKNLVKLDGSDPMLLYGFGAFESWSDPDFDVAKLSLLDRGFIYGIAHIRGGAEMGRQWYENGKFLKKNNTFTDFIACAEALIEMKYSSREKLCIEGRGSGGLLVGAVLNMRPTLFKAAIAEVPLVDLLTSSLDPTVPYTSSRWEEFGDPRKEEFYFYIKSYSPVDNVRAQNYPNILVTAGLHDPVTMYSEPAKYVAKLRDMKTDHNLLLFKCDIASGHFSKSGRFKQFEEVAFKYTFILKALDMIPTPDSAEK